MTQVIYRICDFCRQQINANEPFVCSVTTVTSNGAQKNFDCCEKCFNRLNTVPSKEFRGNIGGVLWGQNET